MKEAENAFRKVSNETQANTNNTGVVKESYIKGFEDGAGLMFNSVFEWLKENITSYIATREYHGNDIYDGYDICNFEKDLINEFEEISLPLQKTNKKEGNNQ